MCINLLQERIQEVLHALEMIPLSENTVRYYGFCYRTLLYYCEEKGITEFSQNHAEKLFYSPAGTG